MEVLKLAYFVALKLPDYWYLEFPYFRYVWYCLCNGSKNNLIFYKCGDLLQFVNAHGHRTTKS